MVKLSVNVNKVATLRNSRGGKLPNVHDAVRVCVEAGAPGITVHPRADERHITRADVHEIAALLRARPERIEFNIEGDPRPELIELVLKVRPTQCTLVPVRPGEITSQAGWPEDTPLDSMRPIVRRLKNAGVRVSLFVDPVAAAITWAAEAGADRVELYTEPYARACHHGREHGDSSFRRYADAAEQAHQQHLGINAGHDLDLENLKLFRHLPHLAEVSIGHALISHALYVGLDKAVRDFLAALDPEPRA
jgi:pyridoxine 5-phosphate synthase